MTPQETDPDLPVSIQESPAEAWVDSQGHWIQQFWEPQGAGISPFEEAKLHPSAENWIKDLLSMAPPTSLPHSQEVYLPSGSFQKPLILIH